MEDSKTAQVTLEALQYPSKWDIIPIHGSDRAAFKFCRRQWAWSSPSKANLVPSVQLNGIYEPFWFGTGIHHALEHYYNPTLQEDPATVWLTWFDLQWNGGIVSAKEVAGFADRYPTEQDDGTYQIMGLNELIPFGDEGQTQEHFEHLRDLGRGMMEFYTNYAETYDNFDVIATEHEFSVPLLDPRTGEPLYMPDTRTMPEGWLEQASNTDSPENIYGPLYKVHMRPNGDVLVEKQVHARGRQDIVIRDRENGTYGIRDYKTTATVPDSDYFQHLELDEQCTTYLWAGELEAKMFDLPYKKLQFIDYVALFKGYPKPPTITSRGLPSLNRKEESTTARLFEQTIDVMNLRPLFDADVKMQSYYNWLVKMGDKRFIWPERIPRNSIQRQNAGIRIFYEALDMLNPDIKLYPNPTKNYGCLRCNFRAPCIAAESGADFKSILEDGYVKNWDR